MNGLTAHQARQTVQNLFKRFSSEIFQDTNGCYSSKRVVAAVSLIVMVIAFFADLVFHVASSEYIFDGFLVLTLGSLGITGVEAFANRKTTAITKIEADVNVDDPESSEK